MPRTWKFQGNEILSSSAGCGGRASDEGGLFVNGDFGLFLSLKKIDFLSLCRVGICESSGGQEADDETRDMVDWFMSGKGRRKN
jgi:hypothetical protein